MKNKNKNKMFKKILIVISTFIISTQPVNADESNINKISQKFNLFWQSINKKAEDTKDHQIKKWTEAKKQNAKKLKIVKNKLTSFFPDFPKLDKKQ